MTENVLVATSFYEIEEFIAPYVRKFHMNDGSVIMVLCVDYDSYHDDDWISIGVKAWTVYGDIDGAVEFIKRRYFRLVPVSVFRKMLLGMYVCENYGICKVEDLTDELLEDWNLKEDIDNWDKAFQVYSKKLANLGLSGLQENNLSEF